MIDISQLCYDIIWIKIIKFEWSVINRRQKVEIVDFYSFMFLSFIIFENIIEQSMGNALTYSSDQID